MPVRAAKSIIKRLSEQCYRYGNIVATKPYLLLLVSLSFISYFSIPIVSKSFSDVIAPTLRNNIPLSHISTSLDAQCWHSSAHVQFNNFTLSRHPPTNYLVTEQIRLSHPDKSVTFELIQLAQKLYESITTTVVTVNSNSAPVSMATICYKHHGHCLIHAPPFAQFNDEATWKTKTRLNQHAPYEHHPYSCYSNATFDRQGQFVKADAILLTFVLGQTQHGNTLVIWNRILQQVKLKFGIQDIQQPSDSNSLIWSTISNTVPHMVQYKFNLFPYDVSYSVQLTVVAYIFIFLLVSIAFGKSNLVKSGYTFGLAAVALSIACFTTTWGIFDKLGISFHFVPWYLLLLVVNIGCLENIFLLTNAVLDAGCDMIVKEKISRGLQSVGIPMTATLIAELLILGVGTYMESDLVKEFCTFLKMALLVDYALEMTFVIAVLSIDIKRVELTDLDDRQISKRLHELTNYEMENERLQTDYCPVQDAADKKDSRSCAECKEFKTHRVFNAFMLCLIVLLLSLFVSKDYTHHHHYADSSASNSIIDGTSSSGITTISNNIINNGINHVAVREHQDNFHQLALNQLSDQFWSTVNPQKDITWLQIQPPNLFVYGEDTNHIKEHLNYLQHLYQVKSSAIRYKVEHQPSLFRMFILSILQRTFIFVLNINFPILILCLVMIGIITWMTPKWRKQWLVPFIIHCFNQFFLTLIRYFPMQYLKRAYYMCLKGQFFEGGNKEYDADGIHHRGAIAVQDIFNQQQYRANVKMVQVRTLTHQHVADIQSLDANAKQNLVSCGQDGRIILWNASKDKATWMARLDKLYSSRGGVLQALLNPVFFKKKSSGKKAVQQKKKPVRAVTLSKNYLSKARLVKIDQGNKWAVAGYDDGLLRVWNVNTGTLVREMDVHPHLSFAEVHQQQSGNNINNDTPVLRNRFNSMDGSLSPTLSYSSFNSYSTTTTSTRKNNIDRILAMQFIGTITEFCHPLVAEAAARCGSSDVEASQNFVVSAHKSGVLHEWDILSGECIQTIKTGHTKDITQLHVVDSKAPHRKLGVTWVFTAAKDGVVKCWERRLLPRSEEDFEDLDGQHTTRWTLAYTLKHKTSVTSITTELPVGGMGILVTGCSDGTVKVWNFETGEAVCTLSSGKAKISSAATAASASASATASCVSDFNLSTVAGGPIRKFSKFTTPIAHSDSEEEEDTSDSSSSGSKLSRRAAADHRGAIYQVVATRYCEVENGPGLCRGCDTCFGNGFLIASSSMDNKVHAWRLERSDNGHEGSCTLCTKDYHRKQYRHRKPSVSNSDDGVSDTGATLLHKTVVTPSGRRRRSTQQQQQHRSPVVKKRSTAIINDDMMELLDIEQLAGDAHIPLKSSFLGKIDQPAGHGVVFCDKILAGVRRRKASCSDDTRKHAHHGSGPGEWEAWFASLQYYDPSVASTGSTINMKIPIETFDLDNDQQNISLLSHQDTKEDESTTAAATSQVLKDALLGLFGSAASPQTNVKDQLKYKRITTENDHDLKKQFESDDDSDLDIGMEASENLPFSTVRHIIPLDGCGLACDFGNFIKLVYLDKPSLTEKERLKQTRDTMEDHKKRLVEQVVVEEPEEELDACQCGPSEDTCNPSNKGKDGCCGGVNKEKNGGQCCGGTGGVKKKQQEMRKQRQLQKQREAAAVAAVARAADNTTTISSCGGFKSIAECSLKNNCSRASDCMSTNQALAASHVSTLSSLKNWLQ